MTATQLIKSFTYLVIASRAKQSRAAQITLDCHGLRPRNDGMGFDGFGNDRRGAIA